MLHHRRGQGAVGLLGYSQTASAHLLSDLLESGDIVSNVLSIEKGHDSIPPVVNAKVSQGHFSLPRKLGDLVASMHTSLGRAGPHPQTRVR